MKKYLGSLWNEIAACKNWLLVTVLTLMPFAGYSQGNVNVGESEYLVFYILVAVVFFAMLLVLMVAIYALNVLKSIIKNDQQSRGIEVVETSWWSNVGAKLTDAVPVEEESTVLLSHDYDGIQELDNHLPPWWKWLFYLTIVYGIIYIGVYHIWKVAPLQDESFRLELQAAAKANSNEQNNENLITAENVTLITDNATLTTGQNLFKGNCIACHGELGEGKPNLGPNLTDEYWLHGGGINNIFNTIYEGVQGTGMISWKTQMSPENIQAVASYVISLEGSDPPNAREPQGEIWTSPIDEVEIQSDTISSQNLDSLTP